MVRSALPDHPRQRARRGTPRKRGHAASLRAGVASRCAPMCRPHGWGGWRARATHGRRAPRVRPQRGRARQRRCRASGPDCNRRTPRHAHATHSVAAAVVRRVCPLPVSARCPAHRTMTAAGGTASCNRRTPRHAHATHSVAAAVVRRICPSPCPHIVRLIAR